MTTPQTSQETNGPVVVGVDGSATSLGALRYAVDEARRSGALLQLVHVVPDYVPVPPAVAINPADLTEAGTAVLASAEQQLREIDPDLPYEGWLRHGTRAVQLAAAAEGAAMLVVGRDERPLVSRLLRGDTATAVAARAGVPVVEVPADWRPRLDDGIRTVLVGVKSFDRTAALLDDAFRVASQVHGRVEILHAWRLPSGYDDIIASRAVAQDWERQVREEFAPQLDLWHDLYPDVPVDVHLVHDYAGPALVHAAEHADVVVIARRAHGVPAATHLGATARAVLRSASCPVRVVPPEPAPEHHGLVVAAESGGQR